MTGSTTHKTASEVIGTCDLTRAGNTKAALVLAVASIALTGAFVFGFNAEERQAINWFMPLGSAAGFVSAALSMRAPVVRSQNWLAGGTVALAATAALAVGIVSPLQALIAAGSLVTGLAFAFGNSKRLAVKNVTDFNNVPDLEFVAALSNCKIVQCDKRSKINAAGDLKFKTGSMLMDYVHVADRPAFLLGLSAAAKADQVLTVRMQTHTQHFAETEIKIQSHNGKLFVALFAVDRSTAEKHASDASRELAHELRTPLAAMVGLAEAIHQNETCTEEMRSTYPALIAQAGRTLIELTGDILNNRNVVSERPQVRLGAVARECLTLLEPMALQQSIALFNRVPDLLCDKLVDGGAMRQIMINLITNAVKFSPAGSSVEVNASISANGWTLSIADNGNGIAPEDIARLGHKNFRSQKTANLAGFGLGLSIVRRLVDEQNAQISFESRPGKGTKVVIAFPASTLVELADFKHQAAVGPEPHPRFNNAAGAQHAAA
jgi:signal transduction histidine kinase